MMRGRLVLVDLSKDGRLVVDRLRPPPEQTGRQARNLASEGQFRTRHYTHRQSGIIRSGKARVPVPKSRVASLSPTFAGRERTLWRLKSHISGSPSLEALQPHETLVRLRSSRITQNLTSPRQRVMGEVFHPVEPKLRKVPWSLS